MLEAEYIISFQHVNRFLPPSKFRLNLIDPYAAVKIYSNDVESQSIAYCKPEICLISNQ